MSRRRGASLLVLASRFPFPRITYEPAAARALELPLFTQPEGATARNAFAAGTMH